MSFTDDSTALNFDGIKCVSNCHSDKTYLSSDEKRCVSVCVSFEYIDYKCIACP